MKLTPEEERTLKRLLQKLRDEEVNETDLDSKNVTAKGTSKKELKRIVVEHIREMGIHANLKGYEYMKEAIMIVVKDPESSYQITKTIYPSIAKKYKATVELAERNIRNAIKVSWERVPMEVKKRMFGNSIDPNGKKPTNSQYISAIADHIRMDHLEPID